jgi:hypothetical protein
MLASLVVDPSFRGSPVLGAAVTSVFDIESIPRTLPFAPSPARIRFAGELEKTGDLCRL